MFTQEQILEIKQRLRETSAKDTEFPLASLPLEGDETITVVQGGENKKFPIDLFFESFSQYIDGSQRVDFFNVSRYVQITKGYPEAARLTLPEAVESCPEDVRRPGQVITFMDNNDNWVTWQYNEEKKEQWLDTDYWKVLITTIDPVPTEGSHNPVSSGGVYSAMSRMGGNLSDMVEVSGEAVSPDTMRVSAPFDAGEIFYTSVPPGSTSEFVRARMYYVSKKSGAANTLLTNEEYFASTASGAEAVRLSSEYELTTDLHDYVKKEDIVDYLEEDNPNPVSSGGVFERVSELELKLDTLSKKNLIDNQNGWELFGGETQGIVYNELPESVKAPAGEEIYASPIAVAYNTPLCYSFYADEDPDADVIIYFSENLPEHSSDVDDVSNPHAVLEFTKLNNDNYKDTTKKTRYFATVNMPFGGYVIIKHAKEGVNVICPQLEFGKTPTEYSAEMTDYINSHRSENSVSYDVEQNLSTANKAMALANISAIGYQEQELTPEQKEQAQRNIGIEAPTYATAEQIHALFS